MKNVALNSSILKKRNVFNVSYSQNGSIHGDLELLADDSNQINSFLRINDIVVEGTIVISANESEFIPGNTVSYSFFPSEKIIVTNGDMLSVFFYSVEDKSILTESDQHIVSTQHSEDSYYISDTIDSKELNNLSPEIIKQHQQEGTDLQLISRLRRMEDLERLGADSLVTISESFRKNKQWKSLLGLGEILLRPENKQYFSWARFIRAEARFGVGRHKEALKEVTYALKLKPENPWFNLLNANILVSLGELELAHQACQIVLNRTPDNLSAIDMLYKLEGDSGYRRNFADSKWFKSAIPNFNGKIHTYIIETLTVAIAEGDENHFAAILGDPETLKALEETPPTNYGVLYSLIYSCTNVLKNLTDAKSHHVDDSIRHALELAGKNKHIKNLIANIAIAFFERLMALNISTTINFDESLILFLSTLSSICSKMGDKVVANHINSLFDSKHILQTLDKNGLENRIELAFESGEFHKASIYGSHYWRSVPEHNNLTLLHTAKSISVVSGFSSYSRISNHIIISEIYKAAYQGSSNKSEIIEEYQDYLRKLSATIPETKKLALNYSVELAIKRREKLIQLLKVSLTTIYQPDSGRKATSIEKNRGIIFGNKDLKQCHYYRNVQKLQQSESLASLDLEFIDVTESTLPDSLDKVSNCSFVILSRLPATYDNLSILYYARHLGVRIFYDIDDIVFNEKVFPGCLSEYSESIDLATYLHLKLDNVFFREIMHECDEYIVTTATLKNEVAEITGKHESLIHIHKNFVGKELHSLALGSEYHTNNEKVVLFYGSGTKAHKKEFNETLLPAISTCLQNYPNLYVYLIGHFKLPEHLFPYSNRIKIVNQSLDYNTYLTELSAADINIAILEDGILTDAKSELKWFEAGSYGIPSIVTPTETYKELEEDENILFATTQDEWTAKIGLLVESSELRKSIGQRAKRTIAKHYYPNAGAQSLASILHPVSVKTAALPKILLVNVFFNPNTIGGATRVVENLARSLSSSYPEEYEIEVLCAEPTDNKSKHYKLRNYFADNVRVTVVSVPHHSWTTHQDPEMYQVMRRILSESNYSLVHFHCIQLLTASIVDACYDHNTPYALTFHDAWWLSPHLFLIDTEGNSVDSRNPIHFPDLDIQNSNLNDLIDRDSYLSRLITRASARFAVSDGFAEIYRQRCSQPIDVNTNGIERPQNIQRNTNSDRVVVAHIGGISEHKGYFNLRRVASSGNYKNLEFLIVDHALSKGTSYQEQWGTCLARFVPKVEQHEIYKLFSQVDALYAGSIWPESFGLVTREAKAAGVWVIASNVGSIGGDVIDGVDGKLIDPCSDSDIHDSLTQLEINQEQFKKPLSQGQVRTLDEQTAELHLYYQKLLKK